MSKPAKHKLLALFRQLPEAVRAFDWLKEQGYTANEINVLMSDKVAPQFHAIENDDKLDQHDMPSKGSYTTGMLGATFGAGVVAVIAAGLGLIAGGPLGAAIAGSIPGAMVGGLVGGLVGYGFPEDVAHQYHAAIKQEEIALGVDVKSDSHLPMIRSRFQELNAHNIIVV